MSTLSLAPGTLGYDRALEWKEPPSPEESAWCGWTVARAAGRPAARWSALARIGGVHLYLCPPGTESDAEKLFSEPLVAGKRGTPAGGGYVGVDGHVRTAAAYPLTGGAVPATGRIAPSPGPAARPAHARADFLRRRHRQAEPAEVRVAVIDVGFENLDVLRPFGVARVEGPFASPALSSTALSPSPMLSSSLLARPVGRAALPLSRAPGHGTAMAGIILHEVTRARVGLFAIPSIAGAVPAYTGATEIAVAVAEATEAWQADVVLIAMSDGAWGTPRHLRDVLREATRTGRGGRGTVIVCSVGDPAKNHSRAEDSAAMGADDLASQPWVLAVAACDAVGRWQRAAFDYQDVASPGTTYNRFGPSVALVAPGEARVYGGILAADDSSQAAALAASAAAAVLDGAPETTIEDLRAILGLTADVCDEIDRGSGLGASVCDGRDRQGHSFKVGYGRVNGAAAVLAASDPIAAALFATRRCPDPAGGAKSFAHHIAEAWEATWRAGLDADSPWWDLAAEYGVVRGWLARAALRSPAAGEALAWLARHARAIAEEEGGAWFAASQDHGALVDRLVHAVDVLGRAFDAGPRDDATASAWLARCAAALAASDPGAVSAVFGAVVQRARRAAGLQTTHDFSPDGPRPTPSLAQPAYHPACFAGGFRGGGSAGSGAAAGGDAGGDDTGDATG